MTDTSPYTHERQAEVSTYPEISVASKINTRSRRKSGTLVHPGTRDGISRPDANLTASVETKVGPVGSLHHARVVSPTIA